MLGLTAGTIPAVSALCDKVAVYPCFDGLRKKLTAFTVKMQQRQIDAIAAAAVNHCYQSHGQPRDIQPKLTSSTAEGMSGDKITRHPIQCVQIGHTRDFPVDVFVYRKRVSTLAQTSAHDFFHSNLPFLLLCIYYTTSNTTCQQKNIAKITMFQLFLY